MTIEQSPTSTMTTPGVAGRTNYAKWDKLATTLVQQVEEESKLEEEEEKAKLGLDGKYAVSADDAAERAKAEELKKTKAKLDAIQQRENAVILELNDIKVLPLELTRENVPSHKRVVRVSDVVGPGQVIFTSDLSKLERVVDTAATTTVGNAINPLAKSFPDDAENDVDETAAAQTPDGTTKRSVYGLIKLMVERCENVEIIVQCKLISGTIEVHQCENVTVVVQDPTVTTLQVDLSNNCAIRFEGGSGCWDAQHTRILHAGCQQMHVSIVDDSKKVVSEVTADYLADGAVAIGNAKPTEFQFITSMPLKDSTQLITEAVAKSGVKAMTKRELEESQRNRNKALARATEMAEGMVQIKDKDGNPLVAKTTTSTTTTSATTTTTTATTATTASTTTTLLQTDDEIMAECEAFKVQGNASFAAGEYAQSLLYYSLAIDKAAALGNQQDAALSKAATLPKFPVDVLYSNRAAACLKLGQHERALADADLALAINPDNLKATFRKGLALHAGGQYYTALPILAAAHKREPSNKQIKQALQFCEVRVEQDQRKRMTKS